MYWFVNYAARMTTRARVEAPHAGLPTMGNWLSCAIPSSADLPMSCCTAILSESDWREVCDQLSLDFEQACHEEGRCTVCETGPLPVLFLEPQPVALPGIEATTLDVRKCVAGPLATIAVELPGQPATLGAATKREVSLCVAPLPESDADRERARSLFAAVAFNVGGAEAELRCPDCASPELRWLGGSDVEGQMGCDNCGTRLARESAFLRLGDCEGFLGTVPAVPLAADAAVPPTP